MSIPELESETAAKQDVMATPLQERSQALDTSLERLDKALAGLFERLDRVLVAAEPRDETKKESADKNRTSPHVDRMDRWINDLRVTEDRVLDVMRRLEV